MPNLANAKKALRQSKKRAVKNLKAKVDAKAVIKEVKKAVIAKDTTKAEELLKSARKKLDKIAKKGYFKKNKVSRLKSRLAKKLNTAKAGGVKKEEKVANPSPEASDEKAKPETEPKKNE